MGHCWGGLAGIGWGLVGRAGRVRGIPRWGALEVAGRPTVDT